MTNKPVWVADSETDPFEHGIVPKPFIWGLYGPGVNGGEGLEYREYLGSGSAFECTKTDIDVLVDFLSEQDVIVYAHNGGKFDWHFLSHRFEADSEVLVIHGRLSRFTIGKCEFRDSYNLLPVALEQYNKMKFDYTKMNREHRASHLPEIQEYLKSDCVNLWNMVSGFVESYGLHITQASAAMHYWQKTLKNKVPRSGPSHYDRFKPFYYGGRVQCFAKGDFEIDAVSADINSAYPYAMLSEHPYGLDYELCEGEPDEPEADWGPMFFTLECESRGAFPYRALNDSLYFPDDGESRIYTVTGWELLAALETDRVENLAIMDHYKFAETKDFSQYVNFFWNLRQQFKKAGDKGGEFYCKIFLNALYGKFATDPRKHKIYTLKPQSDLQKVINKLGAGDTFKNFREWLIVMQEKENAGKNGFYNLATAASITGYVRAMLLRAIHGAISPFYCDTDCVVAAGFGPDVRLSGELGEWSIEHEYDRLIVAGKKLYGFRKSADCYKRERAEIKNKEQVNRWKIASKGARLTHRELIRIARGETVRFRNDAPTFSATKEKPTFVSRDIQRTGSDISFIPRELDPKYAVDR